MRLVIIQEPGVEPGQFQPKILDLDYDPQHPVLRVGRHSSNDIVLSDASVSRHHSEIEVRPNGLMVCDMGSSNGTFVSNQRLNPQQRVFVRPGEQLRIGNVITVLEPGPVPMPPSLEPYQRPPQARYEEPINQNPAYPPVPEASKVAKPKNKPTSGPNWVVIGALLGMVILGLGVLTFVILQVFNSNSNNAQSVLPPNIFASPANDEAILNITMAHPSTWQKTEAANGTQVTFYKPGSPTIVITLEKPPGLIITDPKLTPEAALRQYIANVRTNSQGFSSLLEPTPTKLKDGTPGYFAQIVFSSKVQPLVTNYTVNVLTFKCGNTLYFASTGAEDKDYNGVTKQDLGAAIANFKC
jgi:hypothetical protein